MTYCKKECPKQARKPRHCLDSLEIPLQHPCISLLPGCKPPRCQELTQQDHQDNPLACLIAPHHPAPHIGLPSSQIKRHCRPKSPHPYEVKHRFHELGSTACQKIPTHCTFKPIASQKRRVIRNPLCHCGSAESSHGSTNCRTLSQNSNDILNCDYENYCSQRGVCKNVEETNMDCSHSACHTDRSDNNEKDKPYNDNKYDNNLITDSNTPSKTDQTGNKMFINAAGSAKSKIISNADNSAGPNNIIEILPSPEKNCFSNDTNPYRKLQNERSRSFNGLVTLEGNSPQPFGNMESSSSWQTIPCCQSSYSQATQINSPEIGVIEEFNNKKTSRNTDNTYKKYSYTPLETTTNGTGQNKNNDEYRDRQDVPSGSFRSQYKQISSGENITNLRNFKPSCCSDSKEKIEPQIMESSYPESNLKNSSNTHVSCDSKVHVQEPTTCCYTSDRGSNNNINNRQEIFPSADKTDLGMTADESQKLFQNSVIFKGSKQFANCCKSGISTLLVKDAECVKNIACVQDVGGSTCGSTICVANKMASGCACRYPPAFKQFSCAGNINGTCNCNDKSKMQ